MKFRKHTLETKPEQQKLLDAKARGLVKIRDNGDPDNPDFRKPRFSNLTGGGVVLVEYLITKETNL